MLCNDATENRGTVTPFSNTGLNSQPLSQTALSVRPDWIQGTMRFASLEVLHAAIDFLEGYLKERFVLHPGRGRFIGKQWHNSAQGIEGCVITYNLPDEQADSIGHAFISLTGVVLAGIEARDIWRLASGLYHNWGFKITRLDIALDDFSKSISYEMVDVALASGNYTGFKRASSRRNYNGKGKVVGFTCTFGSRSSARYARFYDKDAESKGRIKSHRFEAELHDELAEKVLADWLALEPEAFEELSPGYLAGVVVGSVSFVQRGRDKNVTRMALLPWWREFVDKVGATIRHSIESVQTSYERKRNWFTRQVSVTLAMFKKIMGVRQFKQYLEKELSDAEERFNGTHETFVSVYGQGDAPIDFSWDMAQ